MPGILSASFEGAQSNVVIDTVPYDILHRLTCQTLPTSYQVQAVFRVPRKPDENASSANIISNAQKRRQVVYIPETFTAEFPARMGTTAIIASVNTFLDKVNNQAIAGESTPGLHATVRDQFIAAVTAIVNPVPSSVVDLSDPNLPVTP